MTSLAFMLELVPDPVWNTSTGNWESWSPAATARAACTIASATGGVSRPSSPLAAAAADFIRPRAADELTGEAGRLRA